MNINLANKKTLVGGSTRGLGKAIALQMAACGATVTLMARNEEKLKETIILLPTPLNQIHNYLVTDFANFEGFKSDINKYFENNSIDILVNNTNGPSAGTVFEKSDLDYFAAFQLLFQTTCYVTTQALVSMRKQHFGRIINVCSITVKEPLPHLVLSNTMRSAVVSWAKTLSTEVAVNNITVNNILTGYFDTERLNEIIHHQANINNISTESQKKNMEANIPFKRLGKPEEYGHLVAFLASDYASYITGTSIPIDGGLLKS